MLQQGNRNLGCTRRAGGARLKRAKKKSVITGKKERGQKKGEGEKKNPPRLMKSLWQRGRDCGERAGKKSELPTTHQRSKSNKHWGAKKNSKNPKCLRWEKGKTGGKRGKRRKIVGCGLRDGGRGGGGGGISFENINRRGGSETFESITNTGGNKGVPWNLTCVGG